MTGIEVLCALIMVVGLVGVVVQVLPGTLLVLGAVLLWAVTAGSGGAWVVLGVAALVVTAAAIGKYLLAGRTLKRADVPNRSMLVGGVAGVVGFVVVPVIGLPLFFVLGVYLAEHLRLRDPRKAWTATKAAIKATGITILVELAGAMLAIGAWVVGVVVTG